MITLFVINELSVLRLLVLAALGRPVLIIDIEPFFPYTRGGLMRIASALVGMGKAKWAIEEAPELRNVKDVPRRSLLYDVFGKIEAWQNAHFRFADAEGLAGEYALAYKQAVTNYVTRKHVSLLVVRALLDGRMEKPCVGVGLPADTQAAVNAFSDKPLACGINLTPLWLINLAYFTGAVLVSLVWIMRHTNIAGPGPKSIFFAADFIADPQDVQLYRELEEGGEILMVPRGDARNAPLAREVSGYRFCERGDGCLRRTELMPAIGMVFSHLGRFFRHFAGVHPALFRRLMALVYQRLLYRGLFSRFRPKFFWGRDPYSEDHIIRRQELNRVGGLSFGVNTGYLTWSILIPETRYVSYDRYYVFGRGKYNPYYADTWAKDMDIQPAGSFTAQRHHYGKRFDARPPDIAVFASVFVGEPELTALVRDLAAAFPDRKIILQVKVHFQNVPESRAFIDACQEGLDNVEYSTDSVYDLFFRARYGISDPSSVVVEAMQFGMISFAFDLPHVQATNVNREYPGLTVETAEQAIRRIRAIEAGTEHYPIEDFQEVVDMSGMVFFDRVRRDMGLAVKEESVPLVENQERRG